jgi:MFS family permease
LNDGSLVPVRPEGRIFYGWWVVIGAFLIQGLTGALLFQSFGAYVVHLRREFGWSFKAIAGAFSLSRVESGMLGPIQGWVIDRFGSRTILRIGLVVFAVGFFLFSRIDQLWQFYGVYLLLSVGASLGGFLTVNTALANWFDQRRATAMGLASTGWGIAGLLVPLVAVSLGTIGWRDTALLSGVIVLGFGIPLSGLIRHAPEPYGYLPDGRQPRGQIVDDNGNGIGNAENEDEDDGHGAVRNFTVKQALRTRAFWLVSTGHAAAMFAVSTIGLLLIPHLEENLDISVQRGALVVAVLTTLSVMGQATTGFLGDRFDKRLIIVTAMVGHTIAMLVLVVADGMTMVMVFAMLHGLSWGFRGPLMTAIRADYFGRKSFATIMGFSSMIIQIGTVLGPLLGGFVGDLTGGDFRPAFMIIALITAIGAVLFALAEPPVHLDDDIPAMGKPSDPSETTEPMAV